MTLTLAIVSHTYKHNTKMMAGAPGWGGAWKGKVEL